MYISVRQYNDVGAPADVAHRVNEEFVPVIKNMLGFLRYYAFDAGNGVFVSVSIFEDKDSAEAANDKAVEWVKENLASLFTGDSPTILSGEVFAASPDWDGESS